MKSSDRAPLPLPQMLFFQRRGVLRPTLNKDGNTAMFLRARKHFIGIVVPWRPFKPIIVETSQLLNRV